MNNILINIDDSMTEVQAKCMAVHILEEEANQLAMFNDLNGEGYKNRPHRVGIAISREITRLRAIAKALKT